MISKEDQIMMETLYWWGIPTLFRCKNDPDPKNCDIALVGVPHSTGNGTTERDQHLGPRAVRNISAMLRRSHLEFGIVPWKQNKIHDLGDVPFPEANNNEKCIERISSFYDQIEKAEKPVVSIGGDHSITGEILQSLAKATGRLRYFMPQSGATMSRAGGRNSSAASILCATVSGDSTRVSRKSMTPT